MPARPLDHLVLPVTDIRLARARLAALGFTVAADARHPFGTENACVFFADKTYLEPLGVASAGEAAAAIRAGNQFIARDSAFRSRNGPEGLSAMVMGTEDADADHAAFTAAGISGGDQLTFSRIMRFPDGTQIEPSFRLSFAAHPRAPDFFGFTCQRINMPPADRSTLETHANGVIAIRTVVLCEADPDDSAAWMEAITGAAPSASDADGMAAQAANCGIEVLNEHGLTSRYGLNLPSSRGLRGAAIVFRVADIAATEVTFASNGIAFIRHAGMLIVPHETGQGVLFAFSE